MPVNSTAPVTQGDVARLSRDVQALADITAKDRASQKRSKTAFQVALACVVALVIVGLVLGFQNRQQAQQLERQDRDLHTVIERQKVILEHQINANSQRLLDQCVTTQTGRKTIREAFDVYTDLLAGFSTVERTPEEQAAFRARVDGFKAEMQSKLLAGLPERECSPAALGVEEPSVPPPPN
jgi:hypothetical protein